MTKCMPMEKPMATRSHGLAHGGIWSSDESSESAFSALSISITTSTERDMVEAVALPAAVKYAHAFELRAVLNSPMPLLEAACQVEKTGLYSALLHSVQRPHEASCEKACLHYEEAIRLDPTNAPAMYNYAGLRSFMRRRQATEQVRA